jgi:hypothetical protein
MAYMDTNDILIIICAENLTTYTRHHFSKRRKTDADYYGFEE